MPHEKGTEGKEIKWTHKNADHKAAISAAVRTEPLGIKQNGTGCPDEM